jgi:hypothetical protein
MVLSLRKHQDITDVVEAGEARAPERDFRSPVGPARALRLLKAHETFSQGEVESFLESIASTLPELLQKRDNVVV